MATESGIPSMLPRIWKNLIRPSPLVNDIESQLRSSLLAAVILGSTLVFLCYDCLTTMTVDGYVAPWYGYITLLSIYLLNRYWSFFVAAVLHLLMPIVVTMSHIFVVGTTNLAASLIFLILGPIFASLYFNPPVVLMIGLLVNSLGFAVVKMLTPIHWENWSSEYTFNLLVTALVALLSWHRNKIEFHRQAQLRQSEERLQLALDSAQMGIWHWNIASDKVWWSNEVERVFGLPLGTFKGDFESFLLQIHPDDLPQVQEVIENALKNPTDTIKMRHRIKPNLGKVKWLEGRGKVLLDKLNRVSGMLGTVVDITEQKIYSDALEKSEQEYRLLADHSTDMIGKLRADGFFLYASPASKGLLGYEPAELLEMSPFSILHPDDFEITQKSLQSLNGGSITATTCNRLRKKNGDYIWVETVAKRIQPENSENEFEIITTSRDITERKHAENRLLESEARYRLLFENMTTGFALHEILYDEHGKPNDYRFLEVNPTFELLTGLKSQGITGKRATEVLPNLEPIWIERYSHVAITGEPAFFENYSRELDRYYEVRAFSPTPDRFAVIFSDTTDRRKSEIALQEANRLSQSILSASPDVIYIFDMEQQKTLFNNRQLSSTLGYAEGELSNNPDAEIFQLLHPSDIENLPELLKRWENAKDGEILTTEYRVKHNDGSWKWHQARDTVFRRNNQGKVIQFLGVSVDITTHKESENRNLQLNAELEKRVEARTFELEEANRELEAFSYSVSHDLRAPLRSINGFASILTEEMTEKFDKNILDMLSRIVEGSTRMGHLIDDLLHFSRSSRAQLEKQACDPNVVLISVWDDINNELNGRQIHFDLTELPTCFADVNLLRQVYINLLSNAIKFTRPRTNAKIEASWKKMGDETVYFVRDNGVGFDLSYATKLFGVFQRMHGSENFEGTGVGLALVQRIIRRHGGRIWAETKPDEGACFYFTLE